MPVQTKIQFRRSVAVDWSSINPILSAGEVGYETDSKKFKIGDGTTAWNSLPYAAILPSELNELVDDRTNDLIVAGSNISKNYDDTANTLTISATGVSLVGHNHSSSDITDFNSSVSGLLPVKSIVAGNNITVTPTGDNGFVISSPVNENTVKDIIGSTITGVSGILFNYDSTGKTATISLSDPSIQSTDVTDFNSAVSGLVNGIYAPLNSPALVGVPTVPTATADTNTTQIASTEFVLGQASSTTPLVDGTAAVGTSNKYARADHVHPTDTSRAALSGATFTGPVVIPSGSGNFDTLRVQNIPVSVVGHSHTSLDITNFNSAVSGLLGVKSLTGISGIGITNSAGNQTIAITGIPSSLITDLGNIATTEVIGRTGIHLTYDTVLDHMYIDTTGVSFAGHTHSWSNITDASPIASLSELAYLSGVTAGTASAGRALVVNQDKSITAINSITATGNVTVGGNLVVQGTTTTVNSTTVEVGDNIIRVNTSGLNTGGMEVFTGSDTKSLVWNTSENRWEFSGPSVYTSGSFIGSLVGNASTVTNGVYTTDTGTITSTMIANNTIVNEDINSSAAIAYTKLNLSNSIVNSDINASAAVDYSKLNLSNSIVNGDISASAAIADTKLATISTAGKVSNSATTATSTNTASSIVSRDSSGDFTAGTITANLIGNASTVTNGVYVTDTGTVTNTMLAGNIANNKLVNSSVGLGSTTVSLGSTTNIIAGLSSISGTSTSSPTTLYYCVIDGGTP